MKKKRLEIVGLPIASQTFHESLHPSFFVLTK